MRAVKLALATAAIAIAASAVSLAARANPITYTLSDVTYNDVAHESGFVDGWSPFTFTIDGGVFVSGITPFGDTVGTGGQWDASYVDLTAGVIQFSGIGSGVTLTNVGGDTFSGSFSTDDQAVHCAGGDPSMPQCAITGQLLGWQTSVTDSSSATAVPEPASFAILALGLAFGPIYRRSAKGA